MSNKLERRMYSAQFRAVKDDGKPTKLEGYAAVFDQPSEDLGGFREIIKPGAFARTLKEGADVRALFNHDPNFPLARTKDGGKTGTLRLSEDKQGLKCSIDMPDTQAARDLMALVEAGVVDQMSFGFYVREQNWNMVTDGKESEEMREILDVELFDVSAVTYPAYPQTSLEARSKFMFPEGTPERRAAEQCSDDDCANADCPTHGPAMKAAAEQKSLEAARLKTAQVRTSLIKL